MLSLCWITCLIALQLIGEISGHGRMMNPPARNAMWRFGYPSPVNYDDNQNWCGGASVMINQNKGKCGICGDNYGDPTPRDHEAGGMYGNGVIVKRYSPGQLVDVEIELTTNHQGTFQFKLCSADNPTIEVSQNCLDEHILELFDAHGNVAKKYYIIDPVKRKTFYLKVKLPQAISCSQCVLQWTYVASNTWGNCGNGTEAVGCGPQETFVNCADVAIIPNTGGRPPLKPPHPNDLYYTTNLLTDQMEPLVVRSQLCLATGNYSEIPEMNDWCRQNCLRYPPDCPTEKCKCIDDCNPVGAFSKEPGSDIYCMQNCFKYPPNNCSPDRCACY